MIFSRFTSYSERIAKLKYLKEFKAFAEELLEDILFLDGPPPRPIDGVSTGFRAALVKTPKGTPVASCETWVTGPWRCLIVNCGSIPLGRPRFDLAPADKDAEFIHLVDGKFDKADVKFKKFTDSRSETALNRICYACRTLNLDIPHESAAVYYQAGTQRTFLAWRRKRDDEHFNTLLKGDIDNYLKVGLDGLQRAGVIRNDKSIFRSVATKETDPFLDTPPVPLKDLVNQEAKRRIDSGEPAESVRLDLKISRANMEAMFGHTSSLAFGNESPHRRGNLPSQQILDAVELVRSGEMTPDEAAAHTGANKSTLRGQLRKAGITAQQTLDARIRSAKRQFAAGGDPAKIAIRMKLPVASFT